MEQSLKQWILQYKEQALRSLEIAEREPALATGRLGVDVAPSSRTKQ
jgi:hypothetical protein